ncbi:putative aquaporin NIP7-1 [Cardamine amara subsp. amara]|uniref:Aquaporin NIP7-1 n=1 Tax=Cardamine amara subsp. amara TaxID=228776 RepID=A0ABD1B078_CARAN
MNGEARSRVVDQEAGSTPSTLRDEDHPSTQRKLFRCLPYDIDLNPLRIVMAELVGTFILMFSVCGVISSTQLSGGHVGLVEYAATAGLSVVVVVYSIGHISGAHLNPSITIAFAIFGGFPWSQVPLYITAQTLGATAATLVGVSVYGVNAEMMVTKPALSCVSAFFVELIATSIVVFLVSALHCGPHQNLGNMTGFVIGTVISLGVLITGPISGGSMNPARSLGPAVVAWDFEDIWVYMTAPVIGAIIGVLTYRLISIKSSPSPLSPSASSLLR